MFNRALGLAEEIGADLFSENVTDTIDLVQDTLALKLKSSTDDARRGRRAKGQGGKVRGEGESAKQTADVSTETAD